MIIAQVQVNQSLYVRERAVLYLHDGVGFKYDRYPVPRDRRQLCYIRDAVVEECYPYVTI